MGKPNSNREAKIAKAGKRSGGWNEPPAPKAENRAAREAGEQQFIAKQQLFIERPKIVFDKNKMRFIEKLVQIPVDQIFDPARGRLVRSPIFKDKGSR